MKRDPCVLFCSPFSGIFLDPDIPGKENPVKSCVRGPHGNSQSPLVAPLGQENHRQGISQNHSHRGCRIQPGTAQP